MSFYHFIGIAHPLLSTYSCDCGVIYIIMSVRVDAPLKFSSMSFLINRLAKHAALQLFESMPYLETEKPSNIRCITVEVGLPSKFSFVISNRSLHNEVSFYCSTYC